MALMKTKVCNGVGEANIFLKDKNNIVDPRTHVVNDPDVGILFIYHYQEMDPIRE